jgi:ribonuclease VapC
MADRFTLDAFALLAYFLEQPGNQRVRDLLDRATTGEIELSVTVVNLGEVVYTLQNRRGRLAGVQAFETVANSAVQVVDVDLLLAREAARVKAEQRMGYLDCFVVALAQRLDATVVTGDPDFHRAESIVAIEWLV